MLTGEEFKLWVEVLQKKKQRADEPVKKLCGLLHDQILENCKDVELHDIDQFEFSKRAWLRRQNQIKRLRSEIKDIKQDIRGELDDITTFSS